jgi:hypothetical protein
MTLQHLQDTAGPAAAGTKCLVEVHPPHLLCCVGVVGCVLGCEVHRPLNAVLGHKHNQPVLLHLQQQIVAGVESQCAGASWLLAG